MKHLYIYLLTLCIIMATACTMNESGNINSEKTLEPTLTSDYNVQMNDIAIAVSNAMRASNDFRTLVKDEALRKFDFAYDIMLRPLSKKRLSDIGSTRAAMGEATVGDVLNDFFPSDTKSTGIDIIDSLCAAYPLLQISVPVHLEDWNPDTYTPTVVFVGDDFSERTSLTVGGYDAEGNYVTVDAVNEPDVPVIVIGLNERGGDSLGINGIYDNPNMLKRDSLIIRPDTLTSMPCVPYNLIATITATGINLQWSVSSTLNINGYKIYRKASNESSFTLIGTNIDNNDTTFNDNEYVANMTYQYKVCSYNDTDTAYSSVITVNAPDRPAGISGLYIYPHNKNQIELRWSYAQNHIDSTVICRKLRNSVQDYQPISTIYNRGADYIFDSSIASGLKYIYKVNNYVSMQQSKSQYDMYYAPYRNCSEKSYIYINGAKYTVDTNLIESWLQGPPEFYVIAKSVNLGQTTVVDKSQRCLIAFGDRTSHQVAFNGNAIKQFYEWQTDDWKERLTFYAAEYDFLDFETTFRIKVGFNIMICCIVLKKVDRFWLMSC